MTEEFNEISSTTLDFRSELARQLQELVPEAIADGKVDVAKLKELLGDDGQDESERFGLFWPGKKRALRAAQEPTTATLAPRREQSVDWDITKNVFVEGDNLEVLKILQKRYHGKIKMIYIDPPYNTGKDFIYPDNFKEGIDTYLEWTRQVNEEGKRVSSNSETDGRFHSNWLNMMYPRLKLARNLLSEDGVIFVSIGDAELPQLLKILDEIFGEQLHITTFAWKKRGTGGQVAKNSIIKQVEYVVMFARRLEDLNLSGPKNENEGDEGWRDFRKSGGQWQRSFRPNQYFPFYLGKDGLLALEESDGATAIFPQDSNGVDGFWENGRETATRRLGNGDFRVKSARQGYKIEQRDVAKAVSNAGSFLDIPSTRGTDEIKKYFGDNVVFENPKPVDLLKQLIVIANVQENDLVLDFFAGSGSTADAVMALNADDGVSRNWICVQIPEATEVDSAAFKAGFATISQLCLNRIIKAGNRIKGELTGGLVDVGFRFYGLTETNFKKWNASSVTGSDELEQTLLNFRDNSDDLATPEGILTELLLKQGFSLTEQIRESTLGGLRYFTVGDGALIAYLDEHTKPTLEQLRSALDLGPAMFMILEDAFQGDDELKTNLKQICKTKAIEFWTA